MNQPVPRPVDSLRETLATLVAVPPMPFRPDGSLDLRAYRRLIGDLLDAGVDVLTPNGNTGEFHSLTPTEREVAVAATLEAIGPRRATVIAGIGFDVATAIGMGHAAEAAGADAVMIHQPSHPFRSDAGWVDYHAAIAGALPRLGVVPYVRDARVSSAMLRGLVTRAPNVVAVKYAIPDPIALASLTGDLADLGLTWICGLAELQAPFFWTAGARGFTSGLAVVEPRLSRRLLACLRSGDTAGAMEVWAVVRPFEELRARAGSAANVSVVKEALAIQRRATRTVRPPITTLDRRDRRAVAAILAAWSIIGRARP